MTILVMEETGRIKRGETWITWSRRTHK